MDCILLEKDSALAGAFPLGMACTPRITGRSSHSANQNGNTPVSASVDASYWEDPNNLVSAPSGWLQPSPHRALDISEIRGIIEDYRKAAARDKAAGFDGVERETARGSCSKS